MVSLILNTGFHNTTLWFVVTGILAFGLAKRLSDRRALTVIILMLGFGTAANLFLALYRAYTVPRDIMQDIVSAQEYLEGRPMFPTDMTRRINDAMDRDGPRASLLEAWPALRQREREQLQEMRNSHWVQAHPPFMTLFTVPFVKYFGIVGTQIALTVISLLALALTLGVIRAELFPKANAWLVASIGLAILGWDPALTCLRSGQTGLMLGGLLTLSWYWLRRGLPVWAGVAAGLAITLKLIPGVILVVLVMRHRRAFASALATVVAISLVSLGLTSVQDHIDYSNTSRGVVEMYAAFPGNLSMLGSVARDFRELGISFGVTRAVWMVAGVVLGLLFAWRLRSRSSEASSGGQIDVQFALAMTLIPILSPVAWDHYLVYLILPLAVLASRVSAGGKPGLRVAFAGFLILFVPPDAFYQWLQAVCTSVGLEKPGYWVVPNLRPTGLFFLMFLLFRMLAQPVQARVRETEIRVSAGNDTLNSVQPASPSVREERDARPVESGKT